MGKHLTPVDVVERFMGRPEDFGPAIGLNRKTAYTWRKSSDIRDAGDLPSMRTARQLLALAAERGLPLTAEHLIFGASEAEIAALQTRADAFPFKARARGPIIEAAE